MMMGAAAEESAAGTGPARAVETRTALGFWQWRLAVPGERIFSAGPRCPIIVLAVALERSLDFSQAAKKGTRLSQRQAGRKRNDRESSITLPRTGGGDARCWVP